MPAAPSSGLAEAIDRVRTRMWLIAYRMTGSRDDADDLAQEAVARAIERESSLAHGAGLEGWLLRIATTVALDHLRRRRIERRLTELVDPLDLRELRPHAEERTPEAAAILREDVRFATVVALQHLPPRQRAALILHDVCDCRLSEVADAIGTNANAAKALLNRARAALTRWRSRADLDVVDGSAVVELKGESAVVIRREGTDMLVARIHLETVNGRIGALNVLRDPSRLRWLMTGGTQR